MHIQDAEDCDVQKRVPAREPGQIGKVIRTIQPGFYFEGLDNIFNYMVQSRF